MYKGKSYMYSGNQYYHIKMKFPYPSNDCTRFLDITSFVGYYYVERLLPGSNLAPLENSSQQDSDTQWLVLVGVAGLVLGAVFCGLLMYLKGRIEKVHDERHEVYARLNGDDVD
jgi:hypothetical protein